MTEAHKANKSGGGSRWQINVAGTVIVRYGGDGGRVSPGGLRLQLSADCRRNGVRRFKALTAS